MSEGSLPMRRWTIRLALAAAVVGALALLHQGLVLGSRSSGSLARAAGGTCAACH